MPLPLIVGGVAAVGALFTGAKMIGKLFGSDPDFTQAWMMNRMTGRGGFLKTFFADGLGKMFFGSRTTSAMVNGGFGHGMYGHMAMMGGYNPYMMNPMMMGGGMPYAGISPLSMGMWGMA